MQVYNDTDHVLLVQLSVTGPFPGFPVPLEGDDVSELIEEHRDALPFSDQLPTFDPPKHTAHRGLLMRLITPKRLKENEEFDVAHGRSASSTLPRRGRGRVRQGFADPFTHASRSPTCSACPRRTTGRSRAALQQAPGPGGGVGSTGDEALGHSPLEYLYRPVLATTSRTAGASPATTC